MNTSAERHLAKAQDYLEKGDGFHRKAAEEMVAAMEADPSLSGRTVALQIGRSETYVRRLLAAASRASQTGVFEVNWHSGSNNRTDVLARTLREAPLEQVEQIISDLPRERQKQVAAAAGHEYLKARAELDEEEQRRTIAQHKERQAAGDAISHKTREAAAGFATLGIAGHIEQATDELRELTADASLTPDALKGVLRADAAWRHELQVAAAMVGLEVDLLEVR